MLTVVEVLAQAKAYHRAGQLQEAERLYQQTLHADPNNAEAYYLLGALCQSLGRLKEAAANLQQAVRLQPHHAAAHNHLGVIMVRLGRWDEAILCFQRAVHLKPEDADAQKNLRQAIARGATAVVVTGVPQAPGLVTESPEAHNNLGISLANRGQLDVAVQSFQRALLLKPDYAEAHFNLGTVLCRMGRPAEAVPSLQQAVRLKPDYVEAHHNLGNAFRDLGHMREAVASYGEALRLKPDFVVAHSGLGVALKALGRMEEAVVCYHRALELQPDFAGAHYNLGNVFRDAGKLEDAVVCYQRALELQPDFAAAHNNLGNVLTDQGKLEQAVTCYRRALELMPDFPEAHFNFGNALREQGNLEEAVASYRRTLKLKPDHAAAHNNLGIALRQQGDLGEAVACHRRALELTPDDRVARDNLLCSLQYCSDANLAGLAEAHAEYERRLAAPLRATWRPHANACDGERGLRLGFASPDFGRHPVGYFLVRVLENLDRREGAIVCYSDRVARDDLTARFLAAATTWRDVFGWSDERLAEQIRADQIDILFDLAGHTAKNRLLLFARKPAPIEVTWAGYVGTTGLKAMDYLLADRYEVPQAAEPYYQERVLRMPDSYVTYDPPGYAPPVSPLPALKEGCVTFGSFNNPAKITSQVIEVWGTILRRVPRSRIMLKYRGIDTASATRRLVALFAAQGVGSARLILLGASPHPELLAEYSRVDLALDPFPYNGGLTTCEALWMGVPVITCAGETFASRHSLSHLSNVGLPETVARDLSHYVELAVALAGDLPRLSTLRAGLRARMAASPLCDGKRFAANLMHTLRDVWRAWCYAAPAA